MTKFRNLTVLQTDPIRKRLHVRCHCGNVFEISQEAFDQGLINSCGCRAWTPRRLNKMIEEQKAEIRRAKFFNNWRPGR